MRRPVLFMLLAAALLGAPVVSYASIDDCPQAVKDVRGTQPSTAAIGAALDAAAAAHDVPAPVLRAIAYVESGWRQFNADGTVVASTDAVCGLGIMQVTADSSYSDSDKARLASDYAYNVDQGAAILHAKWVTSQQTPPPTGAAADDPDVIENWYYAICLYNGCGTDATYPTKVANVVADPFRYAPNFTALKAYWFTKPQDAKPDYVFPGAFQARYTPSQAFVFYDHTTGTVSETDPAPTHSLTSTAPPAAAYPARTYGPNDDRTTCSQCGGWRLADGAGLVGRAHWTNTVTGASQSVMRWRPVLPGDGPYRLWAYVPALGTATLGSATYSFGDGHPVTVDQDTAKDTWRLLGDHVLYAGYDVTLGDHAAVGGQQIVGDALRVSAVPTVTIVPAPATVTYGSASYLTATLRHAGTSYAGTYRLSKRALGATTWAPVGTYHFGDAVPVKPSATSEYRATFTSPSTYFTDAVSGVRRVFVRPKVTATLSKTPVPRGTSVTIGVTVAPSHAGKHVVLQRYYSGAWHDALGATLDGNSHASWTFAKSVAGTYYYRVYQPADTNHVAAVSATLTLRVT